MRDADDDSGNIAFCDDVMALRSGSEKAREDSTKDAHLDAPKSNTSRHNGAITKARDEGKDATELKLEKLLFDDTLGFFDNIKEQNKELALSNGKEYSDLEDLEDGDSRGEGEEDEMDELRDEDLFMIDTGGAPAPGSQQLSLVPVKEEEAKDDVAAWSDSDDERLTVSLASHNRLRKLRLTEAEDVVTGKEYTKRLRQQFERLHPAPEWAQPKGHRKKRRRTSGNLYENSSEEATTDEDELDDESLSAQPLARLLQSTQSLTDDSSADSYLGPPRALRPGSIDVQRLRDVSAPQPSAILSLTFHPTISPPLLLSSGPSGLLSMHHISSVSSTSASSSRHHQPTHNPLLTSLAVPSLSISTSTFHPSGTRIFFAGRRRYFHIWDLPSGSVSRVSRFGGHAESQRSCETFRISPCGRYMALVGSAKKGGGVVNILDATTGLWLAQARVEGKNGVADVCWWGNGDGVVLLGKSGEVVEYSVAEKRVVARWADEGAVGATVIGVGGRLPGMDAKTNTVNGKPVGLGPDRWVAVGSQSGIVNIYDRVQWTREKMEEGTVQPKPRKVLQQLVTPTSFLNFSPDGQLLLMASRWKKDALRLVHLPSCTVYKNWPTSGTPLGRITSVAWARNGRLLAVANEAGKIRLWEVRG